MTSLNVIGIAFEHSRAPAKRRQGRELSAVNTYIRRAMGSTTAYFGGPKSATPKPLTADRQGFSLNAAVACTAQQRSKLERIARRAREVLRHSPRRGKGVDPVVGMWECSGTHIESKPRASMACARVVTGIEASVSTT